MTPEELIVSLVRRHMRGVDLFVRHDRLAELPVQLRSLENEFVIGWYQNPFPWSDEFIGFTDTALYVIHGDETSRLPWKDMTAYQGPDSKTKPSGVLICVLGRWHPVRISGSHGQDRINKDAFNLEMVLRAVTGKV